MAKGLASITSTGLKEFIAELNGLAEHFPEISLKALEAQQLVAEEAMKANWVSLVGGSQGGYVYSSIGHSTNYGKAVPASVIGTVGVYKIDSVGAAFGITDKDLNAAQIAYWVEFGTSRLKQGGRKPRSGEVRDEDLVKVNANPFMSQAFYSTFNAQQDAFKAEFNRLADAYYRYTGA